MFWFFLFSLLGNQLHAPDDACGALAGQWGDAVVERAGNVQPSDGWPPEAGLASLAGLGAAPDTQFCRVEGHIEGNIGFELWLPADWNGRMLGAGVGGPAGVYNYRDMAMRVGQGFATVSTDTGHKAANERWMREAKARTDYAHRGVHLTALAAKDLIQRFYGREPDRSYFLGCSGGGRQGLKEMQNYPGDYDGIVAGAPGPNMPLQSVRMLWFALQQQRNPVGALEEDDWSLYADAATAQCDALDGVADGIMENPAACRFDTQTLACRPGQSEGCLPAAKLAMLEYIIAPLQDEEGRPMDGGLFPGVRTRPGPPSPLLRALWADGIYDDPDWDAMTFQRTADLDVVYRQIPELRADRTNIDGFLERGNKAIIYQGWNDPSTNAGPTLDYYTSLAADNGGVGALSQSVRLFMIPGMNHCSGGVSADNFGGWGQLPASGDPESDILWALVRWVEQGEAPQSLVGRNIRNGEVQFTRRLCPFPQAAVFRGANGPPSAADFLCRDEPSLVEMLTE
jgi:feruloyl esterase